MLKNQRDVSFIVQVVRKWLLGREWKTSQLRNKAEISSRSMPHPMLPVGSAQKLSNNSYVDRDRRRLMTPAQVLVDVVHEGKKIEGKVGQTLMSAVIEAGIEMEAACDGNCACSTCHVYIDDKFIDRLPEATDDEEDMLELALFLKKNSRLSCQITLTTELSGMEFKLPSATRNFYAGKLKDGGDDHG